MPNKNKVGQLFRFNIPVSAGIFGISTLLVVGFTVAFSELTQYRSGITFVALAVTAAGAVGGAFYVGKSLALQLEQQNRAEAFSLMARWNSPALFDARSACYRALAVFHNPNEGGANAVTKLLRDDPKLAEHARHILNFLEEIAIAVRVGHVDEEITHSAFVGLVKRLYEAFQPWINEHRSIAKRQDIWIELEGLYERWEKR